ncbi:DMT family transporter [Dysgonomonas sp. GY617]|uniref:DMT family transporter n=1 Tax=Dysgonomonas sp. GY617 TaxID=2780420 RepID=UPI0018834F3A|nr:DMT family transporter [Dysgonomonas sp. GY617]MBF0574443.1 DMT family transporter [Dysgonomonas sp. GY617]
MRVKGYFWGCLSSATYGLIPLFAIPILKKGMLYDSVLFYRFTCTSLLIALLMLVKKESFAITKKELLPLVSLGILFAMSAQFLFWGYQFIAVGTAATILFLYPVFVALLMAILFKEKIPKVSQLAIIIAFLGVSLLYKGENGTSLNLFGVGLLLLSALFYAIYIVIVNKSSVRNMSGYKLTLYAMIFSSLFFLVKASLSGGVEAFPDAISLVDLLMLALLATVVSNIAMVYSVQYIGSTATAVLGAMEPVTAVCVGIFAFKEVFTKNLALGILLIVISVSLIVLSDIISKKIKFKVNHKPKLGNR